MHTCPVTHPERGKLTKSNPVEVHNASVQAFDIEEDGKPSTKDFPATESHQAYDWHNSVVNIITDNKFKEKSQKWKANCPTPKMCLCTNNC